MSSPDPQPVPSDAAAPARMDRSHPIWAAVRTVSTGIGRVLVEVEREPARSGTAVGQGMNADGSRRFEVTLGAHGPGPELVWTIDPEAGTLVIRDGDAAVAEAAWSPAPAEEHATCTVVLAVAEGRVRTLIDGVEVHELPLPAVGGTLAHAPLVGAVGLGAPDRARATVRRLEVTDATGADRLPPLPPHAAPLTSLGLPDAEGRSILAERSRGLTPPCAEWALLRREVDLPTDAPVRRAVLRATGTSPEPGRQFVARIRLNGTDALVAPVRSVAGEVRSEQVEVTALLRPGPNAIAVQAWAPRSPAIQLELRVELADGCELVVGTDEQWRVIPGDAALPARGSIGTGYYAAPREDVTADAFPWGFDEPGFGDSSWPPAARCPDLGVIEPAPFPALRIERCTPARVERDADGTVRVDLGRTIVGGIELTSAGTPASVEIRSGELLDESGAVRWRLATGNAYLDRWELGPAGARCATWGLRVLRYAEIRGLPPEHDLALIRGIRYVHPLGRIGTEASDDPRLDAVFALCRSTMIETNGSLLVDSWSREREPYEADAYLQARCNAAISAESGLGDYTLDYLLRRRTWPTEWPLYLVLYAWEQYLRTGDASALARRAPQLRALLPERWLDAGTGLIRKETGSDGSGSRLDHDIVDWPPSERDGYEFAEVNTVVNAVAHGAWDAMERIERVLGETERAERCADITSRLREGAAALLWDSEAGAFADGLREGQRLGHHAVHASAFAVAFGLAGPDQTRRLGPFLAERGMRASVYAAPVVIQALIAADRIEDAYDLLVADGPRSWRGMITAGAGATMEAWNEQVKPNVSAAHPWGASPLFLLIEQFAGVRILEPRGALVEVAPRLPAALGRLELTVPMAVGALGLRIEREGAAGAADGGGLVLELDVPPGMRVRAGGAEHGPGRHRVRL